MMRETILAAIDRWGCMDAIPDEWQIEFDCIEDHEDCPFSDAVIDDDHLTLQLLQRVTEEQFRRAVTMQLVLDTADVPCLLSGDVSGFYAFVPVSREFAFQDVILWDKLERERLLIECKQAKRHSDVG